MFKWMMRLKRKRISEQGRGPLTLRRWRLVDLGEVGMYCFFDPEKEKIFIYPLTKNEGSDRLNDVVSVSALVEGEGAAPHQINLFRKKVPYAQSAVDNNSGI